MSISSILTAAIWGSAAHGATFAISGLILYKTFHKIYSWHSGDEKETDISKQKLCPINTCCEQ